MQSLNQKDLLSDFIEVTLAKAEDFLKIKETLTRMGIASHKNKTLTQTCHILQKAGKYYIVHFKQMFLLDGKKTDLVDEDLLRRDVIVSLLEQWSLVKTVKPLDVIKEQKVDITVLPFKEKNNWKLVPKYTIGKFKTQ